MLEHEHILKYLLSNTQILNIHYALLDLKYDEPKYANNTTEFIA